MRLPVFFTLLLSLLFIGRGHVAAATVHSGKVQSVRLVRKQPTNVTAIKKLQSLPEHADRVAPQFQEDDYLIDDLDDDDAPELKLKKNKAYPVCVLARPRPARLDTQRHYRYATVPVCVAFSVSASPIYLLQRGLRI